MSEFLRSYRYKGRHRMPANEKRGGGFALERLNRHKQPNTLRKIGGGVLAALFVGTAMLQACSFDKSEQLTGGASIAAAEQPGSPLTEPGVRILPDQSPAELVDRLTGADQPNSTQFGVAGTDLGIPFTLENGSTGFLFGDTFSGRDPGSPDWRSNVMLRSNVTPGSNTPIVFDSAAGIAGPGMAPELLPSPHDTSGNSEWSAIPTDGISFPENANDPTKPKQIISYQSVKNWDKTGEEEWETGYAGLAVSYDGNHFERVGPIWENNNNDDPYQMISMQRDGDDVYVISTKAGRQDGPMMLRKVAADQIMNKDAYQNLGSLFEGKFGEPSLRKLKDGTWAMAYLNLDKGAIVTRFAESPTSDWSEEKTQITFDQLPNLYMGAIHPESTADNLTLIASSWVSPTNNDPGRYDVTQWHGKLYRAVQVS